QTAALVDLLKNPPAGEEATLVDLLENRIPPGVDEAAYVKASFLTAIVKGEASSPLVSKQKAVQLLGMMQGGYNITTLVELLDSGDLGALPAEELQHAVLMPDRVSDVQGSAAHRNGHADAVMGAWANAEWCAKRNEVAGCSKRTVCQVTGDANAEDLSAGPDA